MKKNTLEKKSYFLVIINNINDMNLNIRQGFIILELFLLDYDP